MAKGCHLIIDCKEVPIDICLNDKLMLETLSNAATVAGANVISQTRYRFGHNSPPGFTLAITLDESHITAHSYANENLIAMDIFTCGTVDPEKIFDIFLKNIPIKTYNKHKIDRF